MPETLTLHALESAAAQVAAATSKTPELDELLNEIGESLQLTPTQFERATTSYGAVTDWLADDGSPVAEFLPKLYSQGSLRLDTTCRPLSHTEFDLDVVCQLTHPDTDPAVIYDLLLKRMMEHGTYKKIVSAEHRCIRLNYAGDFHLDIVPARLDPSHPDGKHIFITDRQRKQWWPSNPKGYAEWFEGQVQIVANIKAAMARKDVEPLRAPQPHAERLALRRCVQLLKRWRDVYFKDNMKESPSSIVLTTLCGLLYEGEQHLASAMTDIIDKIVAWSFNRPIRFNNPSNPAEPLTDRWDKQPELYDIFVRAMIDLKVRWYALLEARFPAITDDLKGLFANRPVEDAITKYASRRADARDSGSLRLDQVSKGLSVAAPAVIPTSKSIVVPRNTFHGR